MKIKRLKVCDDNDTKLLEFFHYAVQKSYNECILFKEKEEAHVYVSDQAPDIYQIRMSQDLFDEFEEFLKSFDIDLDDNDVDIAKAKKPDPMYCNCDKPDIVKRGFSHIAYDYCKTCRKEKVSE